MDKRFDNIPMNSETAILARAQTELEKHLAVYEISTWSDMQMTSIILLASDVRQLTDKQIEDTVKDSIYYEDERITMSRNDKKKSMSLSILTS